MAFVSEEITRRDDEEYFNEFGFKDIDKAVLKIADKFANNPKEASEFAKTLSKYDDIIKVGENIGGVVDAICTAIYAGKTIYDAYNAYKNGDTDGAVGKNI